MEFNEALRTPLPKPEVEAVVKSTFKAYERHREDISKGYNYKNATLIELLAITTDEQRQLKSIIDKTEKQRRNTEQHRASRRAEDGLTSRERALKEKLAIVSELLGQGLKQKDIAEKMGLDKRHISKLVKRLKG